MIEYMIIAAFAAIIGVTWHHFLTQPGDILDFWPQFVYKRTRNEKLLKILYACPRCISGQIALWTGFMLQDFTLHIILSHICCIFTAIFLSGMIDKQINK